MDFDYCHYMATEQPFRSEFTNLDNTGAIHKSASYQKLLASNLLHGSAIYSRSRPLLAIRSSSLRLSSGMSGLNTISHFAGITAPPLPESPPRPTRSHRRISPSPAYVVDAPGLHDDYYLNLMAWGTNEVLAIALGQVVHLYCTMTSKTNEIRACFGLNDYVTSVAWIGTTTTPSAQQSGANKLAVGTFQAELQLWDIETCTKLRSLYSHSARIGSLAWSSSDTLASGSLDARILLNDIRARRYTVEVLTHHTEEVCGLAWSPDSNTLASGSNDNRLCLWDATMARSNRTNSTMPRCSNRLHCAAVRALTWSPWERHLLASGGGAADGTIKLWSSMSGHLLRSVATNSQVCALAWSNTTRELMSAHGHRSTTNTVTLWQYPSMDRVCDLTGHTARVLHLAISPNGTSMATAGADETLRFWDVFPSSMSPSSMPPNSGTPGRFNLDRAVIR